MSYGVKEKQWNCGNTCVINLQKAGSIVQDTIELCLSQSPIKVSKMLKPERWQAAFDSDGKVCGFQKLLKLIVMGGIDPCIRAEVWEFLLGCYALDSTAGYRRLLRLARRERYNELLKKCQMMHSTVGTGTLAYVVGSKVMDMRKSYRTEVGKDVVTGSGLATANDDDYTENLCNCSNSCTDTPHANRRGSSSESVDLVSGRESPDSAAYDSSSFIPASSPYGCASSEPHMVDDYFGFPSSSITDLFKSSSFDKNECAAPDDEASSRRKIRFEDNEMHSFRVANNADLIIESERSTTNNVTTSINSEIVPLHTDSVQPMLRSNCDIEIADGLRKSEAAEMPVINKASHGGTVSEDRVSEWLWTLHRIVVDVVRTDSHLEFYQDPRNLGRMSDILAVYAWVDPGTGYCQGMSDLVSPFVVLFEDNADAFWCFEMLMRRTRANFQMEGPTGVMKQLHSLWHILQLTDKEMFSHLSQIGAESLHFAFRMLLVLFRRELSFNDALRMWEMMWAADFDESLASNLEDSCLESLVLQLPTDSITEVHDENIENGNGQRSKSGPLSKSNSSSKSRPLSKSAPLFKSVPLSDKAGMKSPSNFCGLTRSFWHRNERTRVSTVLTSTRKGNDELPVFCVAAILIMNRHKIIKETRSIDDMIKIFNDMVLVIHVRRCIHTAIKLRKKYVYKNQLTKKKIQNQSLSHNQNQNQRQIQIKIQNHEEIQSLNENQSQTPSLSQNPAAQNSEPDFISGSTV